MLATRNCALGLKMLPGSHFPQFRSFVRLLFSEGAQLWPAHIQLCRSLDETSPGPGCIEGLALAPDGWLPLIAQTGECLPGGFAVAIEIRQYGKTIQFHWRSSVAFDDFFEASLDRLP